MKLSKEKTWPKTKESKEIICQKMKKSKEISIRLYSLVQIRGKFGANKKAVP